MFKVWLSHLHTLHCAGRNENGNKGKIKLLVKEQLCTLPFISFITKLEKPGLGGIVPLCLNDTAEQQLQSSVFKQVLNISMSLSWVIYQLLE